MLTRAGAKSIDLTMEGFIDSFLKSLESPDVIDRLKLVFDPTLTSILSPITHKLQDTLTNMQTSKDHLKTEGKKDEKIKCLEHQVIQLTTRYDDLEQYSRHDAVRIFGVPENTPGTTDDKVLALVNGRMQLDPPILLEDIPVSHRIGKVLPKADQDPNPGNASPRPPRPQPIIVKFTSRKTKFRIMEKRKNLHQRTHENQPDDELTVPPESEEEPPADPLPKV